MLDRNLVEQLAYALGTNPGLVEKDWHVVRAFNRPLQSLIAEAQKQPPEVSNFPCIDPVETGADELSALAWRVCIRNRCAKDDDPAIIRHLYDLAALESAIAGAPEFAALVRRTA